MSGSSQHTVLAVNPGSSTVKLALFVLEAEGPRRLAAAHYEDQHAAPEEALPRFLGGEDLPPPTLVAQRVVHGGRRLTRPARIDAEVEAEIERLAAVAPLHNPHALRWIRGCRRTLGAALPQVAVFDTGFYADLPEIASDYAIPYGLAERWSIRRYGFHGIAHQAMWRRWQALEPGRAHAPVITLQLGSGCSATAVEDGQPVDTSMGFSPLEGLIMSTRTGDLDPEVVTYLQRAGGYDPEAISRILNHESGLLGLSGISGDMRALLRRDEPRARLAVDAYCYRVRKYIGAYMAALDGAEGVLFGGGVGEHAASVRERILAGLDWAGIELDLEANARADGKETCISTEASPVAVYVVPVDEAAVMAEAAGAVMTRERES